MYHVVVFGMQPFCVLLLFFSFWLDKNTFKLSWQNDYIRMSFLFFFFSLSFGAVPLHSIYITKQNKTKTIFTSPRTSIWVSQWPVELATYYQQPAWAGGAAQERRQLCSRERTTYKYRLWLASSDSQPRKRIVACYGEDGGWLGMVAVATALSWGGGMLLLASGCCCWRWWGRQEKEGCPLWADCGQDWPKISKMI